MIFRNLNGKLIIVNRFDFKSDEEYYKFLMNIFK